jgi:dolichyl-phosphate-mannose-protein mannosyltransferase
VKVAKDASRKDGSDWSPVRVTAAKQDHQCFDNREFSPRLAAKIRDLLVITGLLCTASLVVNPIGEFAFNDDWSYAWTVGHLFTTGEYKPLQFTPAPMITNIMWGAMFCIPSGVSFTALRISTLVASLVAQSGVYVLVLELRGGRKLALFSSILLGFNPIFFELSYSFDTDVLFTALSIWAVIFLYRNLRDGTISTLLAGTVLAVAATLSRELGLCIPISFAVVYLLRNRTAASVVVRAIVPTLASVVSFGLLRYWLSISGKLPSVLDTKTRELLDAFSSSSHLLRLVTANTYVIMMYLGIFLLPLTVITTASIFRSHHGRSLLHGNARLLTGTSTFGITVLFAGAVSRAVYGGVTSDFLSDGTSVLMPITGWYLVKTGLGPILLNDAWINPLPSLSAGFWLCVSLASFLGALLLLFVGSFYVTDVGLRVFRSKGERDTTDGLFLLLTSTLYLIPLLAATTLDDRYIVPSIPLIAAVVACYSRSLSGLSDREMAGHRYVGIVLSVMFSLFAIVGTRDYLALNRIRWQALNDLMMEYGVGPRDIDGGWEFNGFYLYDPNYVGSEDIDRLHPERFKGPWVRRDTYRVALGPIPGYRIIRQYQYQHWLPLYEQKVMVLRRR